MRYKFILQSIVTLVFLFAMIPANISPVCADDTTPYTLVDNLGKHEIDFHKIYNVQKNDTVLITIQPEGSGIYHSYVYDPDLGGVSDYSGSGGHSHMFVANRTGEYLLKLGSYSTSVVGNYTVESSHRLTPENVTPNTFEDNLGKYETDLHKIYSVKENDTILITIQSETGATYHSYIYDPDMNEVSRDSIYGSGYGHSHMLIANKTGDYFLKVESVSSYVVGNYTVESSHRLTPEEGTPDFFVESSQSTLEVEKASSADATITVYSENGFNSPVSFAVTDAPPNMNALFSPNPVTPPPNGQVDSTLTIQVDSSANEGNYILKVTGESGTLTHWCEINLIIRKMGAHLEISISQSVIIYQSAVNVSGSISPPIADIEIQIEFRLDGSQWDVLESLTTNSYGEFSHLNWKPKSAGFYELRAYWSGNQEFTETRSQIKNLRVDKAPSSIFCSIAPSRITYGESVAISANLSVPSSTGMVTIQWTSNNISWNELVLHVPSEGLYTHNWLPDAGLYSIRTEWTGDNNYLPSTSLSRQLTVEKRSTEVKTELSANIVNPGEYAVITASISPVLAGENITIQVVKNGGDWQNLTCDITDSTGKFIYTWLPENNRQFWIRSIWAGTKNYEGNISKPELLIVEKGFPTISTQIADIFIPTNIELQEDVYASYNVVVTSTQNVIHSGNETLDTSNIGTFDFYIIYLGNETHKSTFYRGEYTVNKIETEIVVDYVPDPIWAGHSTYANYSVCEKKSGKILYNDSIKLDTSTIGSAYVDISYTGNETHNPKSYRLNYDVKEPKDEEKAARERILFLIAIVSFILTCIGSIYGAIRYLNRRKKREKQLKKARALGLFTIDSFLVNLGGKVTIVP